MPLIDVRVSETLSRQKEESLKTQLGQAISLIHGKSEGSLMVQFSDNCRLWFGGSQEGPIVFVNVMLYGTASQEDYQAFSDRVIPLLEQELGAKHVYLKFEEVPNWFWN